MANNEPTCSCGRAQLVPLSELSIGLLTQYLRYEQNNEEWFGAYCPYCGDYVINVLDAAKKAEETAQ